MLYAIFLMEEHYKKQKENIQRMHTHFGPVKYDFCPSSACFGANATELVQHVKTACRRMI